MKNPETKNKTGMKFPQKKIISKDIGDISLDLSKEEKIMQKTPGLMEESLIENITAMNSIFAQKQSERLMLNNLNQIKNFNTSTNKSINDSNQTFNNLVKSENSNSNINVENPLDVPVIIKDSEKKKKKSKNQSKKKKRRKKKRTINKMTYLIIILVIIIIILFIGLIKTYLSVVRNR